MRRSNLPQETENRIKRFIENNHKEHMQQYDQQGLLAELPSHQRTQVINYTHGEIVRKIRFFDNKSREFIWGMLSLFHQMKVYKKDILYGQNDPAADVFFIIKGRVRFLWRHILTKEEEEHYR